MKSGRPLSALCAALLLAPLGAQSFDVPAVTIAGKIRAELTGSLGDFDDPGDAALGDIFSGDLSFTASGDSAEAVLSFRVSAQDPLPPLALDEAFVRAFFGHWTTTAGYQKLTWGRADSFAPLDVVNPLDYSDLTYLDDPAYLKIARPMVHEAWYFGTFSKIEGVFVPTFGAHRFAKNGRWMPDDLRMLENLPGGISAVSFWPKNLDTLKYAQAGIRWTTTIGAADIGAQYFFGNLQRPTVAKITPVSPSPPSLEITLDYDRYHQIGVDWAQVLGDFNLRAETAVNLTADLSGDDPAVRNPFLAWSLGFDRGLFAGITVNLQAAETVRLRDGGISGASIVPGLPADCEGGSDAIATRVTCVLSRTFFRDELELKATSVWDIEGRDFLIIPGVTWTRQDLELKLSGGIFGGNTNGELGQYGGNNFVRAGIRYVF
ncbi:MAG: hypothetical protein LBS64_03375 [Spirochaetaceae bacterium]|nr:hypothetical protein [Spirochaetaceae bacterium]